MILQTKFTTWSTSVKLPMSGCLSKARTEGTWSREGLVAWAWVIETSPWGGTVPWRIFCVEIMRPTGLAAVVEIPLLFILIQRMCMMRSEIEPQCRLIHRVTRWRSHGKYDPDRHCRSPGRYAWRRVQVLVWVDVALIWPTSAATQIVKIPPETASQLSFGKFLSVRVSETRYTVSRVHHSFPIRTTMRPRGAPCFLIHPEKSRRFCGCACFDHSPSLLHAQLTSPFNAL